MYQIDGLYTILVNGVQQFQPANPSAGIANGTEIATAWLNDMQGENLAWLVKAGIAPAQNTPNQVLAAAIALFSAQPLYLATSQTLAVPVWATRAFCRLWGGGGSGSVASSSTQRGAGGGSGGYIEGTALGLTPGGTMPITIGAGGAGVASGPGNSGGSTSIGAGATATGGTGAGPSPYAGGGAGAGAINPTYFAGYVFGGEDGGDGNQTTTEPGGYGGGPFGGRGSTNAGYGGHGPGGGSGGTTIGNSTADGANGLVIVRFMP